MKTATKFLFFQMIIFSLTSATSVYAQDAKNFVKAYNDGTKLGQYVKDTKNSILVIENIHDTRAIMCTYIIQDKEFGYSEQIKSQTGHTEKIYPGEKFVVYRGTIFKFVYIKKAWFVKE